MNTTIALVLAAILQIESSGGTNIRAGDGGRAVGPYQMHPIAVREVNRVWHTNYTLSDRRCPSRSKKMCELTLIYHYRRGVTDPVDLACKWHRPYGKTCNVYRKKAENAISRINLANSLARQRG